MPTLMRLVAFLLGSHHNVVEIEDNDVSQEAYTNHRIGKVVVAKGVGGTPDKLSLLARIGGD